LLDAPQLQDGAWLDAPQLADNALSGFLPEPTPVPMLISEMIALTLDALDALDSYWVDGGFVDGFDGNAISTDTTADNTIIGITVISPADGSTGTFANPFRFASMYWDSHTQTYMTPNRHLNPRSGRWSQPDPFWGIHNFQGSTGAILQSSNLFVFVTNNPVMFLDPSGLYRVNFIDYLRAMGATVSNIVAVNGHQRVYVTYGGTTQAWVLNSGYMDNRDINAHFGWSDFLTEADRYHGVGIVITGGNLYRNVTVPVNYALDKTASYAATLRWWSNISWFYDQVNHLGPWDIKRPIRWNETIGSSFPGTYTDNRFATGFDTIYFRGQRMTPESLGNWTFGYIGASMGFPLPVLFSGSFYAANFPLPFIAFPFSADNLNSQFVNEMVDWVYIMKGFLARE